MRFLSLLMVLFLCNSCSLDDSAVVDLPECKLSSKRMRMEELKEISRAKYREFGRFADFDHITVSTNGCDYVIKSYLESDRHSGMYSFATTYLTSNIVTYSVLGTGATLWNRPYDDRYVPPGAERHLRWWDGPLREPYVDGRKQPENPFTACIPDEVPLPELQISLPSMPAVDTQP
jgi:hypothetical protein